MRGGADEAPVRTARLELVPVGAPFVGALTAGDRAAAAAEIGATVGAWLATDPSHLVQLRLAADAAAAVGFDGFARVVVLPGSPRRAIGSIGFHGPPDDRDRLELGCRIHPAHRGRGYGVEAATALIDWATARFGITRYLLAVPSRRVAPDLAPIEILADRTDDRDATLDGLAILMRWE
jgi:RimJ/RimL family protein N-acetyltransferase